MPTVTQLVASLGGSSLLTPRPGLTPLQAAASAKVLPPLAALQLGERKGLSFLVWKNRAQAMVTACPGAEPESHAGAGEQGFGAFSTTPGVVSWHHGHWGGGRELRDCWVPFKRRTGQLEQAKPHCTNTTSFNLLASERKNSARWCPTRADLPSNPPSTTHPDASVSGDRKGS